MDAGFRVVEVDLGDFLAIFLGNSLRNVWYEGISYTCRLSGKGKELFIIFAFEFFPWHFIGYKGERWGVKKVVKGRGGRFQISSEPWIKVVLK